MKKFYSAALALAAILSLSLQLDAKRKNELVEVRPSIKNPATSFVIFADLQTYKNCEHEIAEYRKALEKEGLGTFIYASDWKRPEQVRGYIYSVNADVAPLEGMLFLGDVPKVKVKGADYLASSPESADGGWIVTDRFYDDFQLTFNFCGRDSTDNTYTYVLSSHGRQEVFCDIYSSRLRVPDSQSENRYDELKSTISSWAANHRNYRFDADKVMRSGNVGKWTCSLDTFLEGDQTMPLSFSDAAAEQETEDLIAIYRMTKESLYSGRNCTSKLLEMMKKSHSATVRKAALDCLAQFADSNCVKGVEAGLEDADENIRCSAARYAAQMGIFPERAAESSLQHEKVPEMVKFVLDESNSLEARIAMANELGLYSRSYNRDKITEGLSVALSRKYECPQPLREEILKTIRRIR